MIDLSLIMSLHTVVMLKRGRIQRFSHLDVTPLLIVILQFVYYNGRNRL